MIVCAYIIMFGEDLSKHNNLHVYNVMKMDLTMHGKFNLFKVGPCSPKLWGNHFLVEKLVKGSTLLSHSRTVIIGPFCVQNELLVCGI